MEQRHASILAHQKINENLGFKSGLFFHTYAGLSRKDKKAHIRFAINFILIREAYDVYKAGE
jgi:hypothetical protein